MLPDDVWGLIYQFVYYLPSYVLLVIAPALFHTFVAIATKIEIIDVDVVEDRVWLVPFTRAMTFEGAFRTFFISALLAPLLEELIFRGIPYLLFGVAGIVVGSAVWVLGHPSWQVKYIRTDSLRKKLLFVATSTIYYSCSALFYSMLWLSGAGLLALVYHAFHNGWITLIDITRRIELPPIWRRYKYVTRRPIGVEEPREPRVFRELKRRLGRAEGEFRFVRRRSIPSVTAEHREFRFVRRKAKK